MKLSSLFIFTLMATLCVSGCGVAKGVIVETKEKVKIITHTELIPVVATFEVPAAVIMQTVRDSSSHLETDFAQSDARLNRDGTLFHSLENKKQTLEKQLDAKVEYKDSIVYRDRGIPVPVEKELSRWQQFRLDAFWWIVLALALLLVPKIYKLWHS